MGQTVLVSHRRIIMKGLIILAVVAAASAAPSCDDCKQAVAGFKDRLLTPESLAEQQAILTLAACPQAPDPAQCEQWVATYWAGIAKVLFTWLTDVKDPCGSLGLGLCKKGFTCDECLGALDFLGGVMVDESYVAEASNTCRDQLIVETVASTLLTVKEPLLRPSQSPCKFCQKLSQPRERRSARMFLVSASTAVSL